MANFSIRMTNTATYIALGKYHKLHYKILKKLDKKDRKFDINVK